MTLGFLILSAVNTQLKVLRAYKTELDPNNATRTLLRKHTGARRWAYTWGHRRKIEEYEKTGKSPTAKALHRELNRLNKADPAEGGVPWIYEVSKCAPQEALRDLDVAYEHFFRRLKEGQKPGFPRFKSKQKGLGGLRLTGRFGSSSATLSFLAWVGFVCKEQAHAHVANVRENELHKISSATTKRFGTVGMEDLNVAGMGRNRCLAKAFHDAALAQLSRQLKYKAAWRGGRVVVADRFFPSTKRCSRCHGEKGEMGLDERVYHCDSCGLVLGRDQNAAENLRQVAASEPETLNACGDDISPRGGRQSSLKQEPNAISGVS